MAHLNWTEKFQEIRTKTFKNTSLKEVCHEIFDLKFFFMI